MNPILSVASPRSQTNRKPPGVALVLVLSFLVIISGLIIAFFSMVTTEASSAGTTAAASSAKTLADSAVSYVMGTIVDATLGRDPSAAEAQSGPQYAWVWASQPGMIRTYDNQGTAQFVYKLYSADEMKVKGAAPTSSDTAGLVQWATSGAKDVWVDMNDPIKVSNGTAVDDIYPIVDPRAAEDFSGANFPGHEETVLGASDHKVAGFRIAKQGALATGGDPNAPAYDVNNNNPAPMPVKWLYVLQDGTMTTARQDGKEAVLNGSAATAANPIKGRIAFWTDDECTKVNINTASQGTYWDVPRVYSTADAGALATVAYSSAVAPQPALNGAGLALCQPVKGEFQRYPGHPATVSLGEIFGFKGTPGLGGGAPTKALNPVLPVPTPSAGYYYTANDVTQIEKYYSLTPRVLPGGSKAGSAGSLDTLPKTDPSSQKPVPDDPPQGGYWRLFSSVDEMLFDAIDPTRSSSATDLVHRVPNAVRTVNGRTASALTPEMMQKAKFFLTPISNAPEVTLYNTPRISMWPTNDVTQVAPWTQQKPSPLFPNGTKMKLTAFDQLAQFCATVGPQSKTGYPFYFTRWNARSQSADFAPGSRNQVLYKYLQALTALPVPGAAGGGTFANKWGADRDQVLTSIFDYVRCVNMQDSTLAPNHVRDEQANPDAYPSRYTPVSVVNRRSEIYFAGGGEVVPIRTSPTVQGFGRYDTVGSVYLLFFAAHAYKWGKETDLAATNPRYHHTPHPLPLETDPIMVESPQSSPIKGATDAMGVVFMVSFFNPMQGNVGNHQKMAYRVDGLDKLVFTPGPLTNVTDPNAKKPSFPVVANYPEGGPWSGVKGGTVFPSGPHYNIVEQGDVRTWHGRGIGGTSSPFMAFQNGLWGKGGVSKTCKDNTSSSDGNYPFFGYTNQIPIPADNTGPTIDFQDRKASNYYYPTSFRLQQTGDIKLETFTKEVADASFNEPAIQTFHFKFPDGVFKIPYAPPLGYKAEFDSIYNYTSGFGDPTRRTPAYADAARSQFLFNGRMTYTDGGEGAPVGASEDQKLYLYTTDNFIMVCDTCVSLEPAGPSFNNIWSDLNLNDTVDHTAGDQRMYAALPDVPTKYFQPNFFYGMAKNKFDSTSIPQFAHNMMRSVGGALVYRGVTPQYPSASMPSYRASLNLGKLINTNVRYGRTPDVPRRVGPASTDTSGNGSGSWVARTDGGMGSWDTGMGLHKDGAYLNKPDEGDQNFLREDNGEYRIPYVYKEDYFNNNGSFFSPNREVPSSMMLGSIPTGVQRFQPWQTLLFNPAINDTSNPGLGTPADHYIADLFWMPMVEPYAISQPFSTAGKINMNYQIQPFTYIKRNTGMRALMASTKIPAITNSLITNYKPEFGEDLARPRVSDVRFPINLEATMVMLDKRFETDIYRSATEITRIPLVPRDSALTIQPTDSYEIINARMNGYWGSGTSATAGHQLTGNNLKDKPYADLYGRLTTKSNTFTVHVRAQALRKANNTAPGRWVAGKDQVVAEYRGSSIIERYIDANDPLLPDFAGVVLSNPNSSALNIDQYYKFRVVSTKRFAP